MPEEILENVDSSNDAGEVETPEEPTTEGQESQDELTEREKQFLARAKKAEAKLKEIKTSKPEPQPDLNKSTEPDYAKLAFLEQRGVKHPDDIKSVMEEAERLKLPLTDILGMEHMKIRLSNSKAQRDAQEAMPKGNVRGTGKTKADVDYWLAKGETPDDLELAEKVINARMQKEQKAGMFSDELYNG